MMRTNNRLLATFAMIAFATACSHQQDLRKPSTQDNFGVQMARMNLWREALFRFQRAVEINPADAMAHNNLAVAFEANGDFDKARKEYLEALKLDRSNQYIQKNYSRFVEFLSRNRKRQQKEVKAASTEAATTASTTPAQTSAAVPPVVDASSAQPPVTTTAPPTPTPETPPPPQPKPPGGGR